MKKYNAVPSDSIGLLNDIMTSTNCKDFTKYMKSLYFTSKRDHTVGGYMDYLDTVETKYCTLYRKNRWIKSSLNSESAFGGEIERGRCYVRDRWKRWA